VDIKEILEYSELNLQKMGVFNKIEENWEALKKILKIFFGISLFII
jgi:hypothetical protein